MKKFDYRYNNILEFKKKKESSIKSELSNAIKVLEDKEKRLVQLKSNKVDCYKNIEELVTVGTSVEQLKNYNSYILNLDKKIQVNLDIIHKQNTEVKSIRFKLLNTSKEVKVFEKLKENYKEEYIYEESKEEEKLTDQLVTYKSYISK